MSKSNRAKRRETAKRVARWLVKHWPQAFSSRPLKIGIYLDITGTPFSAAELADGLRLVTGRASYLKQMLAGAIRYDLDGKEAGAVSPDAAAHAAERLLMLEVKRARRVQEELRQQAPKKPKPNKRLLAAVAKLKAAAAARRVQP